MNAFDKFVKLRLNKRNADEDVLTELKNDYYREKTHLLLDQLRPSHGEEKAKKSEKEFDKLLKDFGVHIVTTRMAFNEDSRLLKPVATFPEDRLVLAEKIAVQHAPQIFNGYGDALKEIEQRFPISSPEIIADENAVHFSAVYKTNGRYNKRISCESPRFDYRIDKAFSMMREELEEQFGEESVCFFSVKAIKVVNEATSSSRGKPKFRISQVLAVYFNKDTKISDQDVAAAHKVCKSIFEESKQIQRIENELFELEGHELTSKLQPLFLDESIAPSDKIAFAIEQLKKLLNRHLKSHYPSTTGHAIKVYFVSLAYEVRDKSLFPTFQVYPHVYRRELPYGSFIIGHPEEVSVSKYLLRNYFKSHSKDDSLSFVVGSDVQHINPAVKISDAFLNDLFRTVDEVVEAAERTDELTELTDQIFLSKKFEVSSNEETVDDVWDVLNVDVQNDGTGGQVGENKSTLAYVIEGHGTDQYQLEKVEQHCQQLPRGILAIEDDQPEFLSNRERKSLLVVAKAFSHLIRHLFHENTLLDYRPQLSSAYEDYSHAGESRAVRDNANRFILASMAVDASIFSRILKHIGIIKKYDLELVNELKNIQQEVFSGTEIGDVDVDLEVAKDLLDQRFKKAVKMIQKGNNPPSKSAVDFVEACPKNFTWAGYAPSLAQALGDRADHSPPSFELMSSGFSAAGLYMALVRSEIRQVAKLSSVKKLKQERDNYRNFVRYKVLSAARSPENSFAFDSTGEDGQESGEKGEHFIVKDNYDERCFGVLVSDLASARKLEPKNQNGGNNSNEGKVETFLNKITNAVASEIIKPEHKNESTDQILDSIKNLFHDNLGHWYSTPTVGDLNSKATQGVLLDGFRLNYEKKIRGCVSNQDNQNWVKLAFNRLIEGDDDSLVSYEKAVFAFKEYSLDPEIVAAFVKHRHSNALTLLSDKYSDDLLTIAHRDLNAQNLVWAGPIRSFMMIDFEHVGVGFWGMDQARLAVNTVVDFMSEADLSEKQLLLERQANAVENAANFLAEVWALYEKGKPKLNSTMNIFGKKNNHKKENWKKNPDILIKGIVQWILRTTWQANEEVLLNEDHFGVFKACLAFSAVKEYEYAIVNIRRLGLDENQVSYFSTILNGPKNLSVQLTNLYNLDEFDFKSAQSRHEFGAISKYLVSYWILSRMFDQIGDFEQL